MIFALTRLAGIRILQLLFLLLRGDASLAQ